MWSSVVSLFVVENVQYQLCFAIFGSSSSGSLTLSFSFGVGWFCYFCGHYCLPARFHPARYSWGMAARCRFMKSSGSASARNRRKSATTPWRGRSYCNGTYSRQYAVAGPGRITRESAITCRVSDRSFHLRRCCSMVSWFTRSSYRCSLRLSSGIGDSDSIKEMRSLRRPCSLRLAGPFPLDS